MGSRVLTFRLSDQDRAKLDTVLAREGATLGEWIRCQIAQGEAPARAEAAQAEAHVEILRAEYDELRAEVARLREERKAAIVLSPDAMTVLEYLFRQCVKLWPEYRGSGGFGEWLADAAFSFFALNARSLGVSLGPYAPGALGATPMLKALLYQVVRGLLQPGAARAR